MGEKEFWQSKTIMRGWQQSWMTNLEETGARLKEESSSVFKIWEWRRETPLNCWDTPGWKIRKVEPTMKEKNDLGEKHLTDDNSFLRQL